MYTEIDEFKKVAIDIANLAGKIIIQAAKFPHTNLKANNTLVTKVDIEVNNLVIESLRKSFPSHSIITEEHAPILQSSPYAWVCDPIDGTVAFANNIPTSIFSLALTKDGKSILGVIYNPFLNELIVATNEQATSNNVQIRVSQNSTLSQTLVGIPIWPDPRESDIKIIKELKNKNAYAFSTCGIGYMGMLVAQGSLSGAVYLGQQAHDIAAIKIIVEQAGGKVTDLNNNEQRYDRSINGAIISNDRVHEELCELVKTTVHDMVKK